MKRIILVVLRCIFKLPYWWFYKLKQYQNKEKYPTIDEGYQFIHNVADEIVKKARVDLECYGLENLPQENGYLITPNHQGLFDIVAVFKTHDKTAKFVLKKELASTILIKDVVKTLDYYALDRSSVRDGAKMVKNVSKEIEAGMNYVIYPEGTRSKQGNKIGEFKGGTFKIALKSHCPIVPVAMIDCYQVFDNNTIKPVKAQIHYLRPIEYDEYKDLKTPEIAALVQSRIQACMDEYC